MQKPPVFLGGAGVEDNQLVAPFDAFVEVFGTDFRYVVHRLQLFAEVLAGHVHPPFGGVVPAGPAVDAALQHGDVDVAETFQRGCGQRGAAAVVVANDDGDAFGRHRRLDDVFDAPPGYQAGARDVRAVVFSRLPDVNEGKLGVPIYEAPQPLCGDYFCHGSLRCVRLGMARPCF